MSRTYVCSACGSPSCWQGEFMCDGAMHASVAVCTCEWSTNALGDAGGAMPLFIDPACPTHGEPS